MIERVIELTVRDNDYEDFLLACGLSQEEIKEAIEKEELEDLVAYNLKKFDINEINKTVEISDTIY